ncbi:4'-phosphopantetheinyl transferase family protein [Thalassospira australica]|uniref:4'-phosphopantetheinyl transferase family protein n=1 Tax=Thalassospira australica TaxID=1528106 RepID=UPI00384F3F46
MENIRILGTSHISMTRDDMGEFDIANGLLRATLAHVAVCGNGEPGEDAENWLHPEELSLARRMSHDGRRNSYIAGRVAAKMCLSQWLATDEPDRFWVRPGVFGQPFVDGSAAIGAGLGHKLPCVSIAHSEDTSMAIAYHRAHPMGIDLAPIDEDAMPLLQAELTRDELALISELSLPECDAAQLLWSCKESLGKTLNTALMVPLPVFEVAELIADTPFITVHYRNFEQYRTIACRNQSGWFSLTLPRATGISDTSWMGCV